ncbi:hypothetical protein DYB35_000975 [Aphanomyces astaci]|uniref:Uncharacterized protein n=1 Tax=Aphanomyces astaci TaxID=112090 RepID=A0A3R6WY53_APHAT|nr:hypothetical protein DYB35_000975 [Aphanomyces astaci]
MGPAPSSLRVHGEFRKYIRQWNILDVMVARMKYKLLTLRYCINMEQLSRILGRQLPDPLVALIFQVFAPKSIRVSPAVPVVDALEVFVGLILVYLPRMYIGLEKTNTFLGYVEFDSLPQMKATSVDGLRKLAAAQLSVVLPPEFAFLSHGRRVAKFNEPNVKAWSLIPFSLLGTPGMHLDDPSYRGKATPDVPHPNDRPAQMFQFRHHDHIVESYPVHVQTIQPVSKHHHFRQYWCGDWLLDQSRLASTSRARLCRRLKKQLRLPMRGMVVKDIHGRIVSNNPRLSHVQSKLRLLALETQLASAAAPSADVQASAMIVDLLEDQDSNHLKPTAGRHRSRLVKSKLKHTKAKWHVVDGHATLPNVWSSTTTTLALESDQVQSFPVVWIRSLAETSSPLDDMDISHKNATDLLHAIVQTLPDKRAINVPDVLGRTMLHHAAVYGHYRLLDVLLAEHALVNVGDAQRNTPLHVAASRCRLKEVSALLTNGASTTALNVHHQLPLLLALYAAHRQRHKVKSNDVLTKYTVIEQVVDLLWDRTPAQWWHVPDVYGVTMFDLEQSIFGDIFQAARAGLVPRIQHLIELRKVSDINTPMSLLQRTALHEACERGRYNACDYLIRHGADVFATDLRGSTPLHVAARRGFDKIVELVVHQYPKSTLLQDINGKTALHLAIEASKSSVALYLIHRMANVHIQDVVGYTPLHVACLMGKQDVASALLAAGASPATNRLSIPTLPTDAPKNRLKSPHLLGLYWKRHMGTTIMIEHSAECLLRGWAVQLFTPHSAAYFELFKLLLHTPGGWSVLATDCQNQPMAHHLVARLADNSSVVVQCLDELAKAQLLSINNLDPQGNTLLLQECKRVCRTNHQSLAVVRCLLHHGANHNLANNARESPLLCAAFYGHDSLLELLLDTVPPDFASKSAQVANSPLHLACLGGHLTTIQILLASGAVLNACAQESPLCFGIRSGKPDVVQLLLHRGADVNVWCPLSRSVGMFGHQSQLREPMDMGSPLTLLLHLVPSVCDDVDVKEAIHYAAAAGQTAIVSALIASGVNPNVKVKHVTRPLGIARRVQPAKFAVGPLYFAYSRGQLVTAAKLHLLGSSVESLPRLRRAIVLDGGLNGWMKLQYVVGRRLDSQQFSQHVSMVRQLEFATSVQWTLVHVACQRGSLDLLQLYVKAGMSLHDITPNHGHTPLTLAIQYEHLTLAQWICDNHAAAVQVKAPHLPLATACGLPAQSVVKRPLVRLLLHQNLVSVSDMGGDGHTALDRAALVGDSVVVDQLLSEAHAKPTVRTVVAALNGHCDDVVQRITTSWHSMEGATFDHLLRIFILASSQSQWPLLLHLLTLSDSAVDPVATWIRRAASCCLILHRAAAANQTDVVKRLLGQGVPADLVVVEIPDTKSPLWYASIHGALNSFLALALHLPHHKSCLPAILQHRAHHTWTLNCLSLPLHSIDTTDVVRIGGYETCTWRNLSGFSCYQAESTKPMRIIHRCIQYWIAHLQHQPLNQDNQTLLHLAAKAGDIPTIQALVQAGAALDVVNNHMQSPAMVVAQRCDATGTKVLEYLWPLLSDDQKAKTCQACTQSSPINLATLRWCLQDTKFFKGMHYAPAILSGQARAVPSQALHVAAIRGHLAILEAFQAAGASAELRTAKGWTAALLAAKHNQLHIVMKFVLQKPAAVLLETLQGESITVVAAKYGAFRVVSWLVLTLNMTPPDMQALVSMDGRTLVHYAALYSQLSFLTTHSCLNQTINTKDSYGCLPLHYALMQGQVEVVQYLCWNGSHVHGAIQSPLLSSDSFDIAMLLGWSPLPGWFSHLLTSNAGQSARQLPTSATRHVNLRTWPFPSTSLLEFAAATGLTTTVSYVLSILRYMPMLCAGTLEVRQRIFVSAVARNHVDVVDILLTSDIVHTIEDTFDHTQVQSQYFGDFIDIAIQQSAHRGLEAMTLCLLRHWKGVGLTHTPAGTDVEPSCFDFAFQFAVVLQHACIYGRLDLIRYLVVRGGATILGYRVDEGPALVYAFAFGQLDAVRVLMQLGAEISALDTYHAPSLKRWFEYKGTSSMCNIWDLSNHTPSEALYVLPTNVVATTLKDNDYMIDLVHPVHRSSYLVLKLAAFGGFTATYTFELTLLEVPSKRLSALSTSEETEALQSQVRALKQELQVLQKDFLQAQQPHRTSPTTSPLPYLPLSPMLHVATTLSTPMDDPVRWTVHTSVPPALFTLGQHATSIVVLKTGLYHVQARANKKRRVHLHVRANGRHMVDPSPCHFFTKKTSLEFVSRSTNHAPAEVRIVAVHVFD